jgi:hypothetical protein
VAVIVVVRLVRVAHALPGQPRIEDRDPICSVIAAQLRAVVHVRYLEVERDGVAVIADLEVPTTLRENLF